MSARRTKGAGPEEAGSRPVANEPSAAEDQPPQEAAAAEQSGPARAPRTKKPAEGQAAIPPAAPDGGRAGYQPVDVDAEVAVLAALLTSPESFDDVAEILVAEDFGNPALSEVYRAVLACDAAGKPFDEITVADELKRSGQFDKVGGRASLVRIMERAATVDNVIHHANIVIEKSKLRRALAAGRVIAGEALAAGAAADDVIEKAETAVMELGRSRAASSMVAMTEAVARTTALLAKAKSKVLIGHSSGFAELDHMTAGFQGGQLITLAARPGAGKSAMALQMARHMAETTGLMVPFLSFEMSTEELTMRMLCTALEHDLLRLRQGDLGGEGVDRKMAVEAAKMSQLPLLIDDNPPETISGLRSAMRRLSRRGPLGGIVVDYLQLMSGDRKGRDENRTQEVSEISRGLKRLATELDVPVIALSQLNRQLEARPNKRPMLSDLRESGCLTADTRILRSDNSEVTLGELVASGARDVSVWATDSDGEAVTATLTHAFASGTKEVYRVRTEAGLVVEASANHPFHTPKGWVALGELGCGSWVAACRPARHRQGAAPAVVWDAICEITPLGPKAVFDATVAGVHNFVANGLVLHNSIEQDSNLVLFVYRDSLYNSAADATIAELIIGKQRNGPQGTIYLDFKSQCAKFSDTKRRPQGAPAGGGGGGGVGGGYGGGGARSGGYGNNDPF